MYKLQFKNEPSRSIWLVGDKVLLGSHSKNDIVISSLGIEDFHASIDISSDKLTLNCKPGRCYVNELPVDAVYQLKANDEIKIGVNKLQIIKSTDIIGEQYLSPVESLVEVLPERKHSDDDACWSLISVNALNSSSKYTISGSVTLGRDRSCDISIPNKLLSRKHSQLVVKNEQLVMIDQDSANGSFHNGVKVEESIVASGDTISFANLDFIVEAPKNLTERRKTHTGLSLNRTMIRTAIDFPRNAGNSNNTENITNSVPVLGTTWQGNNNLTEQGSEFSPAGRMMVVSLIVAVGYGLLFSLFLVY